MTKKSSSVKEIRELERLSQIKNQLMHALQENDQWVSNEGTGIPQYVGDKDFEIDEEFILHMYFGEISRFGCPLHIENPYESKWRPKLAEECPKVKRDWYSALWNKLEYLLNNWNFDQNYTEPKAVPSINPSEEEMMRRYQETIQECMKSITFLKSKVQDLEQKNRQLQINNEEEKEQRLLLDQELQDSQRQNEIVVKENVELRLANEEMKKELIELRKLRDAKKL